MMAKVRMSQHARHSFAAIMLLLCGCVPADKQPPPNTHLPGFDVWMPRGIVVRQTSHPAIGSYQVRSGTSLPALPQPLRDLFPERAPSTKVSWRVETVAFSEPADVAGLLDGALRGLSTSGKGRIVPAGKGRWTSTYEFGKGKLVAGYARCEPWLTIMFIVGLEGDVYDESVALKMVRSVRCRIGNQKAPSLQVSLRIPEHFGLARNTDEPTYFSTLGGGLVTSFTDGDIARDYRVLEKVLGGMFATAMGADSPLKVSITPIKREDGAPSTLSVLTDEKQKVGEVQIGSLYCAEMDSTAMVVIFPDGDPRTNPLELATSLGCPKSDAAETTHATIDAVFSPLCHSGDLGACRHLIEFIQSGNATGSAMSLVQAKAQACSLGVRDYCT
jgi:hypothetical protein